MDFDGFQQFYLPYLKRKLKKELYYHCFDHTVDVLNACTQILNYEIVRGEEADLVKTAAILHDAGYLDVSDEHEQRSAEIAKELLPGYDYSESQIEVVTRLILATKIDHEPVDQLEKIICDADMDYLGRADFLKTGNMLLQELRANDKNISDEKWMAIQIEFLKKHKYYTSFSIEFRKDKKDDNLRRLMSEYSMKT